jgi:hypothetical protein
MQTTKTVVAKTSGGNAVSEPLTMQKRVGSTVYSVTIRFSPDSRETLDDKICRLIKGELKHPQPFSPQTGKLPERSSEL